MITKRNLPIVLLIFGASVFVAFRTLGIGKNPPTKYEKILHNVGEMLKEIHYSPKAIDDNFSKEVFSKYLSDVDVEKNVLMQSDVQALRQQYETKIDDEILGKAPIQFFSAVQEMYKKRMVETEAIYKEILSKPFDFTKDESVSLDYDKIDFPKTDADRREAWRKRLKFLSLERYSDLMDGQEANKAKPDFVAKTNEQMEKEARGRTLKIMDRYYERLKLKVNDDDRFNQFVQTIVQCMDPHTDYFPPVEKRYFDEQMSGHFFGIGASLKDDDGNIKINTLITGSPAWKSQQIHVGDIIAKVAQGNQEPVDLTGYLVEDAVKLIRGTKGTEVRLTIKKTDGSIKVVSLIRDEIVQDESTFARSTIINTDKGKIGYIFLPEFYADFDNQHGSHCSVDVAREVMKLKEDKVDGIVIDLRNNGGGSLTDVVQMVGLFIDQGPVVQVRDRDGRPQIIPDRDKNLLYDGPLAVMVNELSASASEIFAAAIQDYHRGVIIGSSSTYGKGTVQRPIGLDKNFGFIDANSDLGTLKLTLQKFYRISGGSTQLRGVSSDVVLPDLDEYSKIREKDNPDALPWDEIQKADYTPWRYAYDVGHIRNLSSERMKNNSAFSLIQTDAEWLNKRDKVSSLNLDKYREEQKQFKATMKQIETMSKSTAELNVQALPQDANKYVNDKDKADRFQNWMKSLRTDIWLEETVNVVDDMVSQKALVYNK
ncbi:MAG: carboxy terminal-processing peptidase [Bacteroidota bacterium]|nr:carboxy terminal-processing peptidase [Bacteroidota bacterium]MDP4259715.1 carboxy terminal-processing peptidase [Bacteroidota bacterium]